MANPDHLAIFKKGVEYWNGWRKSESNTRVDLAGEDFTALDLKEAALGRADLSGAVFCQANLLMADLGESEGIGANFVKADLRYANLIQARFARADFSEANLDGVMCGSTSLQEAKFERATLKGGLLGGTDLTGADLSHANLERALLPETNFNGARLEGADFQGALLKGTLFVNLNLRTVKGLNSCRHLGPSVLDHGTLARSGPLPLVFLRGCGLPESLIGYLGSLLDQPIQFSSCFISYSTKDQEFADRVHADLQNKGVRCWFAPHDIRSGRKLHDQIDEAIQLYDRLLLILSEHSMNSDWVKTEIAHARQRELNEQRQVLFPISLVPFTRVREWKSFDADTGRDSAREIREYFIPDFSNWKDHDAYQMAFQRLVRDLKAEGTPPLHLR